MKISRSSSRAGLNARLITDNGKGTFSSLPSGWSPAAARTGALLSPSPSPHHLPLGGSSPAAGPLAAVKAGTLEGANPSNKISQAVIYSSGTVFLHGAVTNRHTGLKSVSGREENWELFQTHDCGGCNFILFSVGDGGNTPSVGGTWLGDLPKVHSWPQGSFGSQNISCPSKFRAANSALWQGGKL